MREYAREKAGAAGVDVSFVLSEMERFELPGGAFDLVSCMLVSCSYLLDNETFLHHLDQVADHLVDGGVYVLELVHPRDVLTPDASTVSTWSMERDGTHVEVTWGQPDDPYDPITQVRQTTVEIRVRDEEGERTFWETSPQREFTANEIDALVRASGRFRVVASFGSPDVDVPFDNDKRAWRMVPVLQKMS